jgi:dihydroorotate dehydrogenase electron transfer subunit
MMLPPTITHTACDGFVQSALLVYPKPPIDDFPATILANTPLGNEVFLLTLQVAEGQHQHQRFSCLAGQFFMLDLVPLSLLDGGIMPAFDFRRPFSPLLWDEASGVLQLYYKVVGEGTKRLSCLPVGSVLPLMAPLGNAIGTAVKPASTLLIGGGVGVAPLVYWASQQQVAAQEIPTLVWGSRFGADLAALQPQLQQVFPAGQMLVASNDGTVGIHGTVLDVLTLHQAQWQETVETIIICGPTPMMKACVAYCATAFPLATVLVSLENHMPCGTGACFGCVVGNTTPSGLPLRVCYEGPVFEAKQLAWEV